MSMYNEVECRDVVKIKTNVRHLPNPSYVDVPRPNSSIIINDLAVAPFKIDAVSSISCMKVETPRNCRKDKIEVDATR